MITANNSVGVNHLMLQFIFKLKNNFIFFFKLAFNLTETIILSKTKSFLLLLKLFDIAI